jgi:hypothetical protein
MKYALLIYSRLDPDHVRETEGIDPAVAEVLARPNVSGWVRLRNVESATTVRREAGEALLTDGPFVDSKEFLAGAIIVEADDLDGALALAVELLPLRSGGGIEVRPILEQELGGA